MVDFMVESIGFIIGFLFIILWVPMAGWQCGVASAELITEMFRKDEDHRKPTPQEDPIPDREKRPKKLSGKSSQSSYPVIEDYTEEYKITNPVDF